MNATAKKKQRRWGRRALIGLGVVAVGTGGLWIAIHEVPGFGPALAEGVRSVVGPGPVAWAEDVAYGVADRVNVWRYQDAKPKTFWDEPTTSTPASVRERSAGVASQGSAPVERDFPPPGYEPPFANVASPEDGTWRPMVDPARPDEVAMAKSLVHPDPKRSFAAIAVVAIDRSRMDVELMAGTDEPKSQMVPKDRRPGIVPRERMGTLVAVFNGGFRAMHGQYGMMIRGDTFVVPRDIACTVAYHQDGSLRIGTWANVKALEPEMLAYRQTPPCLVENGTLSKLFGREEYSRNWGAAVGGETIIRRSAIGIDRTGNILFYGLGEAVTAPALARGMQAAGAHGVAQLDVNFSYPRFLLYERAAPDMDPRPTSALIKDLKYTSHEYVAEPSPRDFFYVAWKPRPRAGL